MTIFYMILYYHKGRFSVLAMVNCCVCTTFYYCILTTLDMVPLFWMDGVSVAWRINYPEIIMRLFLFSLKCHVKALIKVKMTRLILMSIEKLLNSTESRNLIIFYFILSRTDRFLITFTRKATICLWRS